MRYIGKYYFIKNLSTKMIVNQMYVVCYLGPKGLVANHNYTKVDTNTLYRTIHEAF